MKRVLSLLIVLASIICLSCVTTGEPVVPPSIDEPYTVDAPKEEPVIEPEPVVEPETEEPVIEPEPVIEEPEPEEEEEEPVDDFDDVEDVIEDNEYLRSIHDIEEEDSITYDEFYQDKAEILEIIEKLSWVMTNFEFENWKTYIAPESLEYYSNPVNLRKAQKKLPDKMIQLKGLRDYFKHVFIPSRKQSQVEEIRYISKKYIKAVEVRAEDNTTIVYYYFVKQNGKWLVKLPEVS